MSEILGVSDLNGIKLKWIIGTHGNWKNQNSGGRFWATSYTALPIQPISLQNWPNWQCCLAGSSKTAPRILIFSIVLGAECSFYVKSIVTYAPQFFGYNNSVLAIVCCSRVLLHTLFSWGPFCGLMTNVTKGVKFSVQTCKIRRNFWEKNMKRLKWRFFYNLNEFALGAIQ